MTLGVMAIGLALASRLLLESQLGLVRTSAELGNPLPRYALAAPALRSRAGGDGPARDSGVAILAAGADLPGRRVAWRGRAPRSGDIERVILDTAGRPDVRHVVLRDVADWRWRPATPRLVDVELTYRARDTSRVPLADVARTWSPPTVERAVWLRVSLRAEASAP